MSDFEIITPIEVSIPEEHTHITIIPMTKSEFKGKSKKLVIYYSLVQIASYEYLIASTSKGICLIMPAERKWSSVETLKKHFSNASFRCQKVGMHKLAADLLKRRYDKVDGLSLHLYGTPFQLMVWKDLLEIPLGKVTSYRDIGKRIGKPRSARPIGRAVGANPIMVVIPCHRVICANGRLGGYRWDVNRKIKLLNQEARAAAKLEGYRNWNPTIL